MLGIGGGGDVVGALAVARRCAELGTPFVAGGVAWERLPIDPHPGPRSVDQIIAAEPLGDRAVLAGPGTRTPEGVRFSESHVAGHLGAPTVLVDVSAGPAGAASGVEAAAGALDCDLVVYVDVGGDAIATGREPGLASPLDGILAVIGAGCDGELTVDEVLMQVAALGRAGAWIGSWSVGAELADELERAAKASGTEASAQVVRCARGEMGEVAIRRGRKRVALSPVGALTFAFDLATAADLLPLVGALREVDGLDAARDRIVAHGARTELDYERDAAAGR